MREVKRFGFSVREVVDDPQKRCLMSCSPYCAIISLVLLMMNWTNEKLRGRVKLPRCDLLVQPPSRESGVSIYQWSVSRLERGQQREV